jgi:NTP pyrophosphatase (non-canonical NTP hydrolase)
MKERTKRRKKQKLHRKSPLQAKNKEEKKTLGDYLWHIFFILLLIAIVLSVLFGSVASGYDYFPGKRFYDRYLGL